MISAIGRATKFVCWTVFVIDTKGIWLIYLINQHQQWNRLADALNTHRYLQFSSLCTCQVVVNWKYAFIWPVDSGFTTNSSLNTSLQAAKLIENTINKKIILETNLTPLMFDYCMIPSQSLCVCYVSYVYVIYNQCEDSVRTGRSQWQTKPICVAAKYSSSSTTDVQC